MSDIYLQITETPTVVTLSAPVVSGALASTVTVANTVTVALDSNSLSALENVTVTVGAAITGTVTVSNFPATQTVAGTVTANVSSQDLYGQSATPSGSFLRSALYYENLVGGGGEFVRVHNDSGGGLPIRTCDTDLVNVVGTVTVGNSVTIGSLPAISGTVTVGNTVNFLSGSDSDTNLVENIAAAIANNNILGISNALPAGTNRIGVVTIGAGTVTLGASTAQIGSVTASISGTVPVSISSVTVGNSVTIGSLPAISGTVTANLPVTEAWAGIYDSGNDCIRIELANLNGDTISPSNPLPISGTVTVGNSVTIGSLPAISGTVTVGAVSTTVTIAHHQGTSVTTSNFTSTTASTTLASANASREVLTIFNEGAGNLHICAGATCTTIAYQVRLSAGDYYEVPLNQTSLTHSAVFATAGTARVTEIS